MRASVAVIVAAIAVAACGNDTEPDRTSVSPGGGESGRGVALQKPPPVVVHAGSDTIELEPWTYCWANGCADGAPPENPPDVASPSELIVEFPEPGWEFSADFKAADDPCARVQTASLESVSDTTHRLTPHGVAGTYDVTVFGRGDAGDLFVTVRWTTPIDGPMPEPDAYVGIIADNDGQVDSYGVEMSVTNLAESPESASVSIAVEAAGGDSVTIQPDRRSTGYDDCSDIEGSLWWDAPEDIGDEAAALGEPPFTYVVTLTLDGVDYVATATWPDDVRPNWEPYVDLTFTPPLPSLAR